MCSHYARSCNVICTLAAACHSIRNYGFYWEKNAFLRCNDNILPNWNLVCLYYSFVNNSICQTAKLTNERKIDMKMRVIYFWLYFIRERKSKKEFHSFDIWAFKQTTHTVTHTNDFSFCIRNVIRKNVLEKLEKCPTFWIYHCITMISRCNDSISSD